MTMLDSFPIRAKARDVAGWARRRLGDVAHEHRVARVAMTLFDLTCAWHRLEGADRLLLQMAAFAHDVGRSLDDKNHPEVGARMILEDRRLALSEADRRRLAFLTFYHRGRVPERGREKILEEQDDVRALRRTLALLRAADALDSRCLETPRLVFAVRQRTLDVLCYLQQDSAEARRKYLRRKKFRLLEEELDCRIQIDLRSSESWSVLV